MWVIQRTICNYTCTVYAKDGHCTAVFDIEEIKWKKAKYDNRKGNGTLVKSYDKDKVLFLGREEGNVWEFMNVDDGWLEWRDVKVPMQIAQNGTKIVALHPDFCNGKWKEKDLYLILNW